MYSYDRRNFRIVASDALPVGTELQVTMRKGVWPPDMLTKNHTLVITEGGSVGGKLKLKEKGQAMGGPYEFRVLSEKEGVFTLLSERSNRGIKVKIKS